jgi:Cof subfamily protein (haloacid dehalogenase superfamily)
MANITETLGVIFLCNVLIKYRRYIGEKMTVKMIVTDLDKTLLDNKGNISEYSKNIIKKCIKKDIIVVFATARPIRATKIFYQIIKPHAIICHNGAEVLVGDKIIHQCGINPEIYDDIIKKLTNYFSEYNLAIEIDDEIYTNFDPSIYWGKMNYRNINNRPNEIADKILIGINNINELDEIKKHLSNELYLERSKGSLDGEIGLIINKEATKWNGIKKLSKYYNIGVEYIVSFGDNENDLEMIKNSGIGIAVGNGIDEIRGMAKYICETNENDGVANWIEKNIL